MLELILMINKDYVLLLAMKLYSTALNFIRPAGAPVLSVLKLKLAAHICDFSLALPFVNITKYVQ